jgi:hypothetical protein
MTSQDFAYWLHGFFEISDSNKLTEKQVQIIKDHLDLVFKKVTPDYTDTETQKDTDIKNVPSEWPYTSWPYTTKPVVPITPYNPNWNPPYNPNPWSEPTVIC